jgi:hypothetical protein
LSLRLGLGGTLGGDGGVVLGLGLLKAAHARKVLAVDH